MGTRSISARAKWRRIIQEQADSGRTVAQFCRSSGIAASSLFAWKRRLARGAAAPAFVEARLQGGGDAVERAEGSEGSASTIEVICAQGRRILVRPGFDRTMLSEVVNALEALA